MSSSSAPPPPETPAEAEARPDRPGFLRGFPDDPELEVLVEAFERGNYRYVRDEAEKLAERTPNRAVREAARELRRRVDPDPLGRVLLVLALLLFGFLLLWTYSQGPR
jgi:hypothetical protein